MTPVDAETAAMTTTRNEKTGTGTTPAVKAETGATAATRNEKAIVAGETPKAEAGTTTAARAAKRIEYAKSITKKRLQELQQEKRNRKSRVM